MRRALIVVVLFVGFTGCSSSSSSSSDPVELCHSAVTAFCNKYFTCFPTEAQQQFTTASNCISTEIANECPTTAAAACTPPQTFNANNANACVTGYANQSCTDFGNNVTPAACDNICT